YRVAIEAPAEYAYRGEGQRTPSGYGVHGGQTGAAGSVVFVLPDGTTWVPPQFGAGNLQPVELQINSPAGGGWGDPEDRDPESVLLDVRDGLISREAAERIYKVALIADCRAVDAV